MQKHSLKYYFLKEFCDSEAKQCPPDGIVQAYDATDGEELWSGKIEGKGYGLAISNGRLLVSTDKGRIHCFE